MITEYLAALAPISPTAVLVRAHGIRGSASPLPAHLSRGPMKLCYQNATLAVLFNPTSPLLYVEGYAVRPDLPIPLEHAWVYDPAADAMYDPTWPEVGGEYFGIAFRSEYVFRATFAAKVYGLFGVNGRRLPSDPAEYLA